MHCPDLSPRFLTFLEDYARKAGKDPDRIIEEAVSQAILRHQSLHGPTAHDALLMPPGVQRTLLGLFPQFDPKTVTDTPFGDFMERLPDRNWTYQAGRIGEWWFLMVSTEPQEFPEPVELRSVETSQAYAWLFGFTKSVKFWSATDRFLLVF